MGISLLCTVTGSRNNDTDKNNALIIDITDRIILSKESINLYNPHPPESVFCHI